MHRISFVMPAYNAQEHIQAAIESIIAQTYKNWELIICDDCSNDNTLGIIKDYQKKYPNIRLIKRKNNSGGCRLPRFDAILLACGEFVCPIDSDDTIEKTYAEKLIFRQQETNSDIVLSRMVICNEDLSQRGVYIPDNLYNINTLLSGKEAVKETIGYWKISMNGLMARSSIYKNYINKNYKSNYNGAFSDEIDHRKLLLCASTVSIADASYFYRQHTSSIVHSISAKSFKSLLANSALLEFVIATFGDEKLILNRAYDEFLENVYRAQQRLYLYNHKYSNKEKKEINKLIEDSYRIIKKQRLTFNKKRNKILSSAYTIFKLYTWVISQIIKLKSK